MEFVKKVIPNFSSFARNQIEKQLKDKIKDENLLEEAVKKFTENPSHLYPITFHQLEKYKIGTLIKDEQRLSAVKTLLAVYQSFMAANNIVKTSGNRNENKNVIVKTIIKDQIPTKTSL